MELSSCPQCSAKRNIPLSFSFFSDKPVPSGSFLQPLRREICAHDAAAYRSVFLLLAFSIGCGLLYTPLLRLEFTLSAVGTFRLLPLWVLVVLLVLALAHWLPLRVLPWKKLESTAAFHRGRSVSFFIISIAISFLVTMLISFQFAPEALMRALY